MPWFLIPLILLSIGTLGLFLTIRSFRKGETVSLKKLFAIVMLILLGGGVFLQKMEIINIPQLHQLMLAFDPEERAKIQQETQKKQDDKLDRIKDGLFNKK